MAREEKNTSLFKNHKDKFILLLTSILFFLMSIFVSLSNLAISNKKGVSCYFDYNHSNFSDYFMNSMESIYNDGYNLIISNGSFSYSDYNGTNTSNAKVFFLKNDETPLFRIHCCNFDGDDYEKFKYSSVVKSYTINDPESMLVSNVLFGKTMFEMWIYDENQYDNFYSFSYYIQGNYNDLKDGNIFELLEDNGVEWYIKNGAASYLKAKQKNDFLYTLIYTFMIGCFFSVISFFGRKELTGRIQIITLVTTSASIVISFLISLVLNYSYAKSLLLFATISFIIGIFIVYIFGRKQTYVDKVNSK